MRRRRSGFALLAVLWVIVGLSALTLGVSLAAREAVSTAANRVSLARAQWLAEDCLERTRATIAPVLEGATTSQFSRPANWLTLDLAVRDSPLLREMRCAVSVRAAGIAIDVNLADAAQLRAAFVRGLRLAPARAESLTDAVMDWRDADQATRPLGAERAWYVAAGRVAAGDTLFADRRELRLVRGVAEVAGLDSLFDVEPGRVVLDLAPVAVLASLPGITDEALSRVAELRARGAVVGDALQLASRLSPSSRDSVAAHYMELVRLTAPEPDAWIVTARAGAGAPALEAAVEVRLVRAGTRAAIVRRRTWP
jgi:general secretion pathway protein K